VLIQAGIPLVDDLGEELFELLREGDWVRIEGTGRKGVDTVVQGQRQDAESVGQANGRRPRGPVGPAGGLRRNTMEY